MRPLRPCASIKMNMVNIAPKCPHLSIVELRVHDDDEVGGEVEAPGEVPWDDHHLDGARLKQLLDELPLQVRQPLVQVRHAVRHRLFQRLKHTYC